MLDKLKELNKLLEQYNEVNKILERYKYLNDAPPLEPLKKVANTLSEIIIKASEQLFTINDDKLLLDALEILCKHIFITDEALTYRENGLEKVTHIYYLEVNDKKVLIDEQEANTLVNAYKLKRSKEKC